MIERGNSISRQSVVGALLEELSECCRSKSLSEDGLRGIIERHGCAAKIDDPSIDYEFFRQACRNERVTEGILRYLLKYFPNAVRYADETGRLPLPIICHNKNITLGMVQLLIDAFPASVRHEDHNGYMPLHLFCINYDLDKEIAVDILKLLLERCPESVRHAARDDILPIHAAAAVQSPEFCRLLNEAYPGSERMADNFLGRLPFHWACTYNTVATAKYLYQLYPESIDVAGNDGCYPIHYAVRGLKKRKDSHDSSIEMVQFLLDCNPDVVLQKLQNKLPLYWVCNEATNASTPKLNAYLKILHILYDAHPEAIIVSNEVTSNIGSFCEEVQSYINAQLSYARQARDQLFMTTRDENGQLPLHRVLRDNATITLGSTKLLVKGNPSSVCTFDNRGTIPLHVACQHHETPAVVDYLIGLNEVTLTTVDRERNTALHYACRGANHEMIALLLDKYGSMSVSKRNTYGQLPIDLLLENNEFCGEESVEYTESIYRLLRANPETIINNSII